MNDTILLLITLILYFIIMMQNYLHLHYPIWKKKTTKQFQNTAHKHPIAFPKTIENALLDTLMY